LACGLASLSHARLPSADVVFPQHPIDGAGIKSADALSGSIQFGE